MNVGIKALFNDIKKMRTAKSIFNFLSNQVIDIGSLKFLFIVSLENHLENNHSKEVNIAFGLKIEKLEVSDCLKFFV